MPTKSVYVLKHLIQLKAAVQSLVAHVVLYDSALSHPSTKVGCIGCVHYAAIMQIHKYIQHPIVL